MEREIGENQIAEKQIGEKLRALRLSNNLSQRSLAKRCGVANATISQIESNRISPTVSMLKKVLDGIPISLGEFFGEVTESQQIFFAKNELTEIGDGGVSFRQVGAQIENKAIQFLHERYQPGKTTGKHALRHEGEECGLVLKGRIEVQVGKEIRILGPGEAYYFKSDQPHRFRNIGKVVCELVTASTPPSF